MRGVRVAGAAAVLWGSVGANGDRIVLATARVLLPAEAHAQVAEAWVGRLPFALLRSHRALAGATLVIGDNLAVVRFGASEGTLCKLALCAVLGPEIARCAQQGITPDWLAVRRRHNGAADSVATLAVLEARDRHDHSCTPRVVWTSGWPTECRPLG